MASRPTHKIDATGKTLGRFAVDVANLLRGKNKVDFAHNIDIGNQVVVYNVEKIYLSGRKKENKLYRSHSGYLGHLKEKNIKEMDSKEVFYKAVRGMLPNNKLRPRWLKRLKIYTGNINEK